MYLTKKCDRHNIPMNVGKYTYGHDAITIFSWGEGVKLIIGKFCSISGGCKIFLGGNHRTDWVTTYPFGHISTHIFNTFDGKGHPATKGDVVIGNDVWIGANVTIMSGVKIGDGAVIANNAHVVKNVEPYSIVGGNPAKLIKLRFEPHVIKRLLEIKWWDWNDAKINKHLKILCSGNIMALLNLKN
jgi:chloramphenicol O-acetyltransferase type B